MSAVQPQRSPTLEPSRGMLARGFAAPLPQLYVQQHLRPSSTAITPSVSGHPRTNVAVRLRLHQQRTVMPSHVNHTVSLTSQDSKQPVEQPTSKHTLLLFEEVDCQLEEDRGFYAALANLITTSKVGTAGKTCAHSHSVLCLYICLLTTARCAWNGMLCMALEESSRMRQLCWQTLVTENKLQNGQHMQQMKPCCSIATSTLVPACIRHT